MGKKTFSYYFNGGIDKIGRIVYPRYKRKQVTLFRYTSALGDALFLTTVAREVKKRNPNTYIHIITGFPALFDRNPDINKVSPEPTGPDKFLGNKLIRYEHKFPWDKHIIYHCCECVDIHSSVDLKTYIFPAEADYKWAEELTEKLKNPIVLINRKAGPRTDKKNWPDDYWIKLISEMVKHYTVIEIGTTVDTTNSFVHNNYINLLGKTSIHQTAALMSKSNLLICPVTGLLHLASAFELRTLCILGGSEPAAGTKYRNTHYIIDRPACSNCYEKGPCMNDFICLKNIHPDIVHNKVKELLLVQ